jgi:Icc protein
MAAPEPLRILHFSDTHLTGDGALHQGRVDTTAALDRLLEQFSALGSLDLVIGTGDLSEDGSPASYELLRSRIEPWARERAAAVVYAMGNHDLRTGFGSVLGNGHSGSHGGAFADAPIDGVTQVGPWRIVTLDSSVPGSGYGELRPEQLNRLRELLSVPADAGTIVALHHPPVPALTTLLRGLELQNPASLADAVRGSDVRAILCGHYHHSLVSSLDGIPVVVSTAVANTTDVLAPAGRERAVVGSGATLVTVGPGGVSSATLRSYGPEDGAEVYDLDAATVDRIIAEAGTGSAA